MPRLSLEPLMQCHGDGRGGRGRTPGWEHGVVGSEWGRGSGLLGSVALCRAGQQCHGDHSALGCAGVMPHPSVEIGHGEGEGGRDARAATARRHKASQGRKSSCHGNWSP